MADFARNFIEGYSVGQQTKLRKEDERRTKEQEPFIKAQQEFAKKQQEWAAEDRDIEKDMLQHRIRELKISEKLQARAAARENLQTMTGTSVKDLSPEQTEGGVLPATSGMPGMEDTIQTRMKSMNIPGIEELGIPDTPARPETREQLMQDRLAELLMAAQAKEAEGYNLARGAKRIVNGRVVAEGSPFPEPREPLIKITESDDTGKIETDRWVTPAEAREIKARRVQPPPRPSAVVVTPDTDITDIVGAIRSGAKPYDLSGYPAKDRPRIDARLAREGFNTSRATADRAAVMASARGMNGATINALRIDADATLAALDDLEALNEKWNNSWGVLSWAGIANTKLNGGEAGRAAATEIEGVMDAVREGIGRIKAGGSQPNNRILDEAQAALTKGQSKTSLAATIKRLRTTLSYRAGAIQSLEPLTGQGAADFEYDPATGQLVPTK